MKPHVLNNIPVNFVAELHVTKHENERTDRQGHKNLNSGGTKSVKESIVSTSDIDLVIPNIEPSKVCSFQI
jgi:hypothetical protein